MFEYNRKKIETKKQRRKKRKRESVDENTDF